MSLDWSSSVAGLVSGLMNFGASAISSSRQWKYTQRAMALQDRYNRDFTRDSYGLMREGLEKAGYNPLLALNSSANSSMPSASAGISDSDIGDQMVNSAIAMRSANAELKRIKAETEGIETDNKIKEKNLKKLSADVETSPKVNIVEALKNPKTFTKKYEKLRNNLGSFGINLPSLPVSSAKSSQHVQQKVIKLHNNQPYVQKGVPRSVVNKFNSIEKKKVDNYQWHEGSAWNNRNYKVKFRYLDDSELR